MTIPNIRGRHTRLAVTGGLILLDFAFVFAGFGIPAAVLTLGMFAWAVFLLFGLVVRRSRLIWSLRNRLMVTYVFVGAVPIVLILALTYVGAWIVAGQVATYIVRSELARRAQALENPARVLAFSPAADRPEVVKDVVPLLRGRAPGFEILVTGDPALRYPADNRIETPSPEWKNYTGIVLRDGDYYCMSLVRGPDAAVVLLAPVTPQLLQSLAPGIGLLRLGGLMVSADPGKKGTALQIDTDAGRGAKFTGAVPPAYNAVDFEFSWGNTLDTADWGEPNRKTTTLLSVVTRPSAVLGVVFADRLDFANEILLAFVVIAGLLAVVELISVVIGVSMTRAITGAVHNLYEGTRRIGQGDFTHRIPVNGGDQLADLGNAFNRMSAQLSNLLVIAKEKERLQSEIDIATDVQNQLFPRCAPESRTIRLIGACEPARSVSGDYYDYLRTGDGTLALAIGDVAGKGISAALLMASIQSIVRTQLGTGAAAAAVAGGEPTQTRLSTARIVEQLNRQLYGSTSQEKYATFFLGLYDEDSRVLTYTNAGHLAPLLIRGGGAQPLEVTGTVVGLFPSMRYDERSVALCSGDLLVGYTDGITEPENAYGEEFGAERLAESVWRNRNCEPAEIVAKVMESVKRWSAAPELPDDMTVMIARGIA